MHVDGGLEETAAHSVLMPGAAGPRCAPVVQGPLAGGDRHEGRSRMRVPPGMSARVDRDLLEGRVAGPRGAASDQRPDGSDLDLDALGDLLATHTKLDLARHRLL